MVHKVFADEKEARAYRDDLIQSTDWTQGGDAENRITHRCVEEYRKYRQEVYISKHQEGWPFEVDFPDMPLLERQEDVITETPNPVAE